MLGYATFRTIFVFALVLGKSNLAYTQDSSSFIDSLRKLGFSIASVKVASISSSNSHSNEIMRSGLLLNFTNGIKSITTFKIKLGSNECEEIKCKSNRSIGFCTFQSSKIPGILFPDSVLTCSLPIIVVYDKSYFVISVPPNYKKYNSIAISFNEKLSRWDALFLRRSNKTWIE